MASPGRSGASPSAASASASTADAASAEIYETPSVDELPAIALASAALFPQAHAADRPLSPRLPWRARRAGSARGDAGSGGSANTVGAIAQPLPTRPRSLHEAGAVARRGGLSGAGAGTERLDSGGSGADASPISPTAPTGPTSPSSHGSSPNGKSSAPGAARHSASKDRAMRTLFASVCATRQTAAVDVVVLFLMMIRLKKKSRVSPMRSASSKAGAVTVRMRQVVALQVSLLLSMRHEARLLLAKTCRRRGNHLGRGLLTRGAVCR